MLPPPVAVALTSKTEVPMVTFSLILFVYLETSNCGVEAEYLTSRSKSDL